MHGARAGARGGNSRKQSEAGLPGHRGRSLSSRAVSRSMASGVGFLPLQGLDERLDERLAAAYGGSFQHRKLTADSDTNLHIMIQVRIVLLFAGARERGRARRRESEAGFRTARRAVHASPLPFPARRRVNHAPGLVPLVPSSAHRSVTPSIPFSLDGEGQGERKPRAAYCRPSGTMPCFCSR